MSLDVGIGNRADHFGFFFLQELIEVGLYKLKSQFPPTAESGFRAVGLGETIFTLVVQRRELTLGRLTLHLGFVVGDRQWCDFQLHTAIQSLEIFPSLGWRDGTRRRNQEPGLGHLANTHRQ